MEGADGIGNEGPMGLKQESWAWTTDNVPWIEVMINHVNEIQSS